MPDLPVGRMAAIAKRVDHRVLEMRSSPPGDEAARLAVPAFLLQEGRHRFGEALLHVDDGSVLVERERLDLALENARLLHRRSLRRLAMLVRLHEAEDVPSGSSRRTPCHKAYAAALRKSSRPRKEVGRKRLNVLDAEACVEMLRGLERRLVSVRRWRALQVHAAAFSQTPA